MRFRIRTFQILIVLLAPPMGLVCQGARFGCAGPVLVVWAALVIAPLVMMCLAKRWITHETARDCSIVFFAAIGVVGYTLAIVFSLFVTTIWTFRGTS